MRAIFRLHYILVFGGFVLGLMAGVMVFDTHPPVFGWLFGAGAGLTGGAFFAALASGQQIVSGPGGGRRERYNRYEADDDEDDWDDIEIPRLLDGIPPRREIDER